MKIRAYSQQRSAPQELVGVEELSINPLLQTGVVLLNLVAVDWISQEECEIRVQIEQGPTQESIHSQNVTVCEISLVVGSECSQADPPTVEGIDKSETVQLAVGHQGERNLARGIEVVGSEVQLEAQRFLVVQVAGIVARDVVSAIAPRIDERPIGVGTVVSDERVSMFPWGAVGDHGAIGAKRTTLQTHCDEIGQALLETNVDDAQSRKVTVFRAKGPLRMSTSSTSSGVRVFSAPR